MRNGSQFQMISATEMMAMQEYITSLERENQAKSLEQELIYRELQALQRQLAGMDRLYNINRELNQEIHRLNAVVLKKQAIIQQSMKAPSLIQELRGEIIHLDGIIKTFQQNKLVLEELLNQERSINQQIKNQAFKLSEQIVSLKDSEKILLLKNEELLLSLERMREQSKLKEEKMSQRWVSEERLQSLASNYVRVQTALIEKEEYVDDLSHEILELRNYCVDLKQEINERQMKISSLQTELEAARQQCHQNEVSALLEKFSKIELIKQSNSLVQRVNCLQRENRGECVQIRKGEDKLMMRLKGLQVKFDSLVESLTL